MTMQLHDLINRVQEAGASLSVNGDKLRVATTATLSDELIAELRAAKPALLKHLSEWDAEDWTAFIEERIAIAVHDGGLDETAARCQAYNCAITEWLCLNPPAPSGPDSCAHCQHPLGQAGEDGVPFLAAGKGHTWLHHNCWDDWMSAQRAAAAAALAEFGIKALT